MQLAERKIRQERAQRQLEAVKWAFEPDTKERYPGHRIRVQIGALIMHDRILDNYVRRPL